MWSTLPIRGKAYLLDPQGTKVALMSVSNARGLAAALNTHAGAAAFKAGRNLEHDMIIDTNFQRCECGTAFISYTGSKKCHACEFKK